MLALLRTTSLAAAAGIAALAPAPAEAESYPIDCAILLCLAGGWPGSAPCVAAKAEFIRRITPWPVEPPLQIWRCPMGGGVRLQRARPQSPWRENPVRDAATGLQPRSVEPDMHAVPTVLSSSGDAAFEPDAIVRFVQGNGGGAERADIDISSPAFDYVRSIRVYSVERLSQRELGQDDDCVRHERVRIGTYGLQGAFAWQEGDPDDLPDAFVGDERWGELCPRVSVRAVFVDWRDYHGSYGFEQVNY